MLLTLVYLSNVLTVKLSRSKGIKLLNAPSVVIAKLLKLNPLKLVVEVVKPSVSIRFKLVAETVPVLEISLIKV